MSDLRTAAQQALEAMEDLLVWHSKNSRAITAITALKAALEQPEQEPVAWMYRDIGVVRFAEKLPSPGMHKTESVALYTHPPRREWHSLTDTERAAVQYESFKRGLTPLEFMELHEAALKEKNHE